MAETAIEIRELTKDFRIGMRGVKLRAVDKLSLNIEDNQVYGLLGPNGSGKSTTIKVILGLLEPTLGSCSVYGKACGSLEARRMIGYLPEAPYFYRYLSGRELVRFYAKVCGMNAEAREERMEEVLKLVGMNEAADRRVGTYSKGMLQRIGLAQALVHDPKLIILDEPTAGVDPIGAGEISEIILNLKERGKTVLLCSHLLAQVESICDHVAIMNRGSLEVQGPVEDLLQRGDRTQLMVDSLSDEAMAEIRTVLEKHKAALHSVDKPRISLDELFVGRMKDGKGREKRVGIDD